MSMRRYSQENPPPETIWHENVRHGLSKGLNRKTAEAYATLTWWGEHLGIRTQPITSGYREPKYQAELRARWDRGDRRGLVVRPALSSSHTRRNGFDLPSGGYLPTLGELAPFAGLRWGGKFREYDPVHFDTETR